MKIGEIVKTDDGDLVQATLELTARDLQFLRLLLGPRSDRMDNDLMDDGGNISQSIYNAVRDIQENCGINTYPVEW